VARSPLSASVSSRASGRGSWRSGASEAISSMTRPSTKRAAFTLPSRCFAATSSRQGVIRRSNGGAGSAITRREQSIESARDLTFTAFGPARLCRRRPREQIEVHPGWRGDKAAHEQRGGDRPALTAADIIDIGDLGFEHRFIRPPQGQPPDRIILGLGRAGQIIGKPIVIGKERGYLRA